MDEGLCLLVFVGEGVKVPCLYERGSYSCLFIWMKGLLLPVLEVDGI